MKEANVSARGRSRWHSFLRVFIGFWTLLSHSDCEHEEGSTDHCAENENGYSAFKIALFW